MNAHKSAKKKKFLFLFLFVYLNSVRDQMPLAMD